jgi:hypothetical protein
MSFAPQACQAIQMIAKVIGWIVAQEEGRP